MKRTQLWVFPQAGWVPVIVCCCVSEWDEGWRVKLQWALIPGLCELGLWTALSLSSAGEREVLSSNNPRVEVNNSPLVSAKEVCTLRAPGLSCFWHPLQKRNHDPNSARCSLWASKGIGTVSSHGGDNVVVILDWLVLFPVFLFFILDFWNNTDLFCICTWTSCSPSTEFPKLMPTGEPIRKAPGQFNSLKRCL